MSNFLQRLLLAVVFSITSAGAVLAQDGSTVWSDRGPVDVGQELTWTSDDGEISGGTSFATISPSEAAALPDAILQIKNVVAGVDLDQDGKMEFLAPVMWDDGGAPRRSVFLFENAGDDAYSIVWSYQFPDSADQFVTVEQSDLDGDGVLEILAVHITKAGEPTEGTELYVFENKGDNDFGTEPTVTWDLGNAGRDIVRVAKAADLDGDGKQEVVLSAFTTQPAILIASVTSFELPVWTSEFVNPGATSPDVAAIGIGDMDGDGTPEAVMSDGATDELIVIEATGANTYMMYTASVPIAGKTVSVHGIELDDANGDGQDEAYFANLQGAVWVVTSDDVSTFTSDDIALIADTEEQWLEASTAQLASGGFGFIIAASNASTAWTYLYTGGDGGDPTDPANYTATETVGPDDFLASIPGGMRLYGLDYGGDMDGDGYGEIVFTRGSTRGGATAPAVFVLELKPDFLAAGGLPDAILQIKNVVAGLDLDQDGKKEFMAPVMWDDGGAPRRSVFLYENTGDDAYSMVWSYQFPDSADQFVTVEQSDLDGDGVLEILAVHITKAGEPTEGTELYVFENKGDNDFGTEPTVTWDLGNAGRDIVRVAKAADLDGDGKQEVVLSAFTTQPAILIASVSSFELPVWTSEFVNPGATSPDVAAIGIGDMDGDGTPEAVMSDGATDELIVIEATGANTYMMYTASVPIAGKTVSVHGIELDDANGDGQDEAYFANLQGAVWVVTSDDVSTFTSDDIALIADTEEQWLEASTAQLASGGFGFIIAASNASTAWTYLYTGGDGGDPTDPANYTATEIVGPDDFLSSIPGGMRLYGLDYGGDMDGDGYGEVVFTRGSTRGGATAPAVFVLELKPDFLAAGGLPDAILQIKNVVAGLDLDQDGKKEFMAPVMWDDGGAPRRSVFLYENTGDDAYSMVWSYQFPDSADQFVTVEQSDLDGDGVLEILAVHITKAGEPTEGTELYVFENKGDNDFGTEPTVTWDLGNAGRDIVRVAKAADLDGDGKQEVVLSAFTTQPAILIASVSSFELPVWTSEFVNPGATSPDVAAIGIGDMDGDGTPEAVMSDGATDELIVIEATGANTYMMYTASVPIAGKTVSVHGIELDDANGDGQDEAYFANLQGAVWVVTSDDVSTFTSDDIALIADTEEQWLEASTAQLASGGFGFIIAASNASTAWTYLYTGGDGGDPTDPANYTATEIVGPDDFLASIPGGMRLYGLDYGGDMDGDGYGEIVFTRGSTRGGATAPAVFVYELDGEFMAVSVDDEDLPDGFKLLQNYPNPFNPETRISYVLSQSASVNLTVFDALGRTVRTLVAGRQVADSHVVVWDGTDGGGTSVSSGLYFYRLDVGGKATSKAMVLLK